MTGKVKENACQICNNKYAVEYRSYIYIHMYTYLELSKLYMCIYIYVFTYNYTDSVYIYTYIYISTCLRPSRHRANKHFIKQLAKVSD